MKYRVFGSVEMETSANKPVPIGSDRQSAFVAAMVARHGQVVSTEQLVELLWGEHPPTNPANAVHVVVSRLRSTVRNAGDEWNDLKTSGQGYVLDVQPDDIDAWRFESLISRAHEVDQQAAVGLLREALSLWRGRAYGSNADTDVAFLESLRLGELRRGAIVALGGALVEVGRSDEATAILEPLAAEYPFDEQIRGGLMRSLYEQGRHPEALGVYNDFSNVLGEELGLEPSASLRQLELDILRHDLPSGSATGRAPASTLAALRVRHLTFNGGTIAWASVGNGPRLMVVPAWVTSLDVIAAGRDPRSSILDRLTPHAELILYDRRGTGVSGGEVDDFSTETQSRELEAVLEATGGRATVLAMSQAGPAAIDLATRRPDLISSLVLFGTFASGPDAFDNPELSAAILDVLRSHWGVGSRLLAGLYRHDASEAAADHLGRVLYDSAPRDIAVGYLETVYTSDVSGILSDVACPTLVIHYHNDQVIPYSGAIQLAGGIPDAQLLSLDGSQHLPDIGDLDLVESAVRDMLETHNRDPQR